MATPDYDYTRETGTSTGGGGGAGDVDDFEIPDAACPTKDAGQIEDENSFESILPGDHLLKVVGFLGAPEAKFKTVFVDGRQTSFTSHLVKVRFSLADNPRATIIDNFLVPPAEPDELNAYYNGSGSAGKAGGFEANKFYQFIGRLGFVYPPGGRLPAEARRLGNWKGRTIWATVVEGKPYTDGNGVEKPGNNQVKLFSYRASEATIQGLAGDPTPADPGPSRSASRSSQAPLPMARNPKAPASASAAVGAGNRYQDSGLNDL